MTVTVNLRPWCVDIVAKPPRSLRLLVHIGSAPRKRIRAMLVEQTEQDTLFGDKQIQRWEQKSFPSKEVLICRKPAASQ
jgi:hypothetical protein